MAVDEQPHSMRRLGRQAMELERTEQAYDGRWSALADIDERSLLVHSRVHESIETAVDLLEDAALDEAGEVAARDVVGGKVARAYRAAACEAQKSIGFGRSSLGHGTKSRLVHAPTDFLYLLCRYMQSSGSSFGLRTGPLRRSGSSWRTTCCKCTYPQLPAGRPIDALTMISIEFELCCWPS